MKPASRIQATIEVLDSFEGARVPMDSRVGDYMRSRRYIGAKDRAEVVERVYNIARHFSRLGWWLKKENLEDTPRHRVIVWLALGEGIEEKRFADLFDGSQYAPTPIDEDEHKFIREIVGKPLIHAEMPEAVQVECPVSHEERLRGVFGKDFKSEMAAMLEPAPLDLRVNTFLLKRGEAQKSLAKDGVQTVETPYSPWGLRCLEKAYLSKTKAFHKGWVEIQDEGSQLIALVCAAKPGMQVLDYCAGGGGKTLALAAMMERKGRIVAMDLDEKRLERGRRRYKKAGLADIIEVRPLSDEKHRKWFKRQKEKFDIVLTDVPCSGSGTWRRNPDMRWNDYGPNLEDLNQIQSDILESASAAVKPGGRLVYATCSLFPEENELQIEAFLKRHEEFECLALSEERPEIISGPYMRLTPKHHKTDGFFAAVLQKRV